MSFWKRKPKKKVFEGAFEPVANPKNADDDGDTFSLSDAVDLMVPKYEHGVEAPRGRAGQMNDFNARVQTDKWQSRLTKSNTYQFNDSLEQTGGSEEPDQVSETDEGPSNVARSEEPE